MYRDKVKFVYVLLSLNGELSDLFILSLTFNSLVFDLDFIDIESFLLVIDASDTFEAFPLDERRSSG